MTILLNHVTETGIFPERVCFSKAYLALKSSKCLRFVRPNPTERLLMGEPQRAQEILKDCQNSGLIISIDDFGTGYSSLSYLHYFPINILKIDRSFIVDIEKNKSSSNLVSSIISLGHNIGMSIIAEGIEEQTQSDLLKDMGCDKIQGYFYSRPVPENDIIKYMAEQA